MSVLPSLTSGTWFRGAAITIPFAAATRWLNSWRRSRARGAFPAGLKIGESMMVRGAVPTFTVRTTIVTGGDLREPSHEGAPALPARPAFEISRTEKVDRARGKHSSAARELPGRMVTVGGCTSLDESETTTRFPRETCHVSGVSNGEYEAPGGSRSCDMR